jgi:DNA-binding NtrC family response regulator
MAEKASRNGRILVVDDDPSSIVFITEILKKTGLEVIIAKDGEEALNKFSSNSFELILTDLMMPKMDGLTLLKEIKKKEKDAVVLIITGFETIESAVSAIKAGAYDYISKSIKADELELVINRALEKKRLISQLHSLKGIFIATIISIPIWLVIGVIIGWIWK